MSSTKGGTHNEQQNASEENLKHSDKKARKRITTPKQRACIKTALYTCITTRQLKVVLELGDELDKRAANGGCNEEYNESINALISSLSKNKASKRVKGASSTRSRPRPRRKQPDVALVRTDDHGRTEFDVASITIGSFTVNDGGDDLSRAVVRFCFAIGVMTYEFVHKEDEKCYKVCYSIPFDDIASINFLKKIVHLKLKKPAKQSFCTLGTLVSGLSDSEVLGNAVDVDVSRGQVESNLLHTIHLKRGTTKVWQEALLAANGDLFESLIRGSVGMDEAESTPTRAASMAALEPFNRGGSYSSPFEGHTELEQVEPAYDSGVFGSVHGSSDMQLLDSATTGNVRYFDQASDFISGELNPCSRQDPTSTGMFAEYYHPVAGGLPPFEDLTALVKIRRLRACLRSIIIP
ncbi:hypothetical protein Tcan_04281 [Toxocara canis]|uniref:Uncharacterized protein n=1 Tax=Toxocara canis TaxID=6265 RepID=A0A0B2VSY3_TOXCA|nr:hypothetical protein Tcan_04281 [Toxocara canis]